LATTLLDHLVIVVSQTGQPDQTQTVAASNLHGAMTTAAFTNVAAGNATITITAYDASNNVLGSAVQNAVVAPGQTNKVDTTVSLGHGDFQTVHTPLADDGATQAAEPVETGSQLGSFPGGGRLVPGLNGSIYYETVVFFQAVLGPRGFFIGLRHVDPDGTTHFMDDLPAGTLSPVNDFAYSPSSGIMWEAVRPAQLVNVAQRKTTTLGFTATGVAAISNGDGLFGAPKLVRVKPDGTKTTTTIPGGGKVAVDAADNVWTVVAATPPATGLVHGVSKYDLAGTLLASTALPFEPKQMILDGAGNAWLNDTAEGTALAAPAPGTSVAKVASDGTLVGVFNVAGRQMAADAAGNVWVSGPELKKLGPDGTVLGSFPIDSTGVTVATDGTVWVTGSRTRKLYKIAP
jgi:hypothetical protein